MLERVVLKYLKWILNMQTRAPFYGYIDIACSLSGQRSSQAHLLNRTVFIMQVIVYIGLQTTTIIRKNGFTQLMIFLVK